jgi:uncharacterized membrane protein YcaP (DUF421 family)
MEAVIRPLVIYFFLLIVFAVAGKKSLSQMDTVDFVTLLILSESTQNALIGENNSMTYGIIVIITLVTCSFLMAKWKAKSNSLEQVLQGGPTILVENGRLFRDKMKSVFVDEQDILSSARQYQGIERLDQIKFAILETSGQISIIKKNDKD